MSRVPTGKRIQLTDRDLEVFRLLQRYPYLRSSHLRALVTGKSDKRFIERLGDLYHEGGYLNRPVQQWQAMNARYMPVVYELGDAGEQALVERGLLIEGASLLQRRRGTGGQFHHQLMVCDIVSSIEVGVRQNRDLRLVSSQEILRKAPAAVRNSPSPFEIPVSVSYTFGKSRHQCDKPLIPDALFGIEYNTDGKKTYRFSALEADRNSEPVYRSNLSQTSYLRKILQYREVIARQTYKTHLGLPNLLVLTVTVNEQHLQNIITMVNELTGGQGNTSFLFKTMPSLTSLERSPPPTPCILTTPWRRAGHSDFYIDQP